MSSHRERDDVAAYLLGALDEAERDAFEGHLAGCAECAEQLERLAPAAGVLPGAVTQLEPPPSLKARIMSEVVRDAELLRAAGPSADRPRRRRFSLRGLSPSGALAGAFTAALLAGAAGFALHAVTTEDDAAVETIVATVDQGDAPGARAWVERVEDRAELLVRGLPQPPRGRIYQVWLMKAGGAPIATDALFTVTTGGSGTVDIPGDLHEVQQVLVTDEPAGGSRRPTREPVIAVGLS